MKKICIKDAQVLEDREKLIIQREKGFLAVGTPAVGGGIMEVKRIVNQFNCSESLPGSGSKGSETRSLGEVPQTSNDLDVPTDSMILLNPSDTGGSVTLNNFNVTAVVTGDYIKYFSNDADYLWMNIMVFVDEFMDEETLLELFKTTSDAKFAALWDMGLLNHFSFDPMNCGDSIVLACKGNGNPSDEEVIETIEKTAECVRKAVAELLKICGFPKDVLGFMEDVGVTVDNLTDAGMELVVGVEKTDEIREKLRMQIIKSLHDLNVVSFIIAGIRLEEDYEKHRVHGVDVDDDPAYLYSDEVFGMSVANQIAGTKAIFNFKRYDEAKPGIISHLGPVLDDVFAGLVAGCMSKIFEE
ncbi:phosphatidylglycerophosphatase A [Methanobacterium aggregans]|uniref:phosphatidylglycerophosphatase A n=1 Tax=Methanobacterium aggregans TaxID=1615586 RepID=UPI001FDA3ABC|nr:phosphatidylglycerophosphatase A [Methanobacterium aggregans]MBP2046248.1 alpha-ribazole phosphatase CobZ [Methanobacterium aggregans]